MQPDKYTNQELFVEVGDGHELYVQDWGNPKAKQVIFSLHGGPGSASRDKHKAGFNPETQRVIFHDQRGCGRSLPYGSIEHNTTKELTEDISKIADKLDIKTFILTGGSWGSCLALTYALKHPKRVSAMILRGIFTGSQGEIDWIDEGLFKDFYPESWQAYLEATPTKHRNNPSAYHHKQILSDDAESIKKSAYAYGCLEGSVMALDDRFIADDYTTFDPAGTKIEMYYLQNRCFLPDRYILNNAHKLAMPVWLVQGRYDMVCPPITAYELDNAMPDSQLIWTLGGHQAEHETWNIMRSILLQLTA